MTPVAPSGKLWPAPYFILPWRSASGLMPLTSRLVENSCTQE